MDCEKRLLDLQLTLPNLPAAGGKYAAVKYLNDYLLYISGCGPNTKDATYCGHLGADVSVEEGARAAADCALNLLSILKHTLGDLDRIRSIVKMTAFVSSTPDFYQQPAVADGATVLLESVFGAEVGLPSRSAIGVPSLPNNIPVEIELLVAIKGPSDDTLLRDM